MPKSKSYKFSPSQSTWLKQHLDGYIKAQDEDSSNPSDDLEACKIYLGRIYDALVKKYASIDVSLAAEITTVSQFDNPFHHTTS